MVFFPETQVIDLFDYEKQSFGDYAAKIKQILLKSDKENPMGKKTL